MTDTYYFNTTTLFYAKIFQKVKRRENEKITLAKIPGQ
ncbi:hypothetical protein NAMH_1328 [Nautilia profundicola AmH]|uniref:Uncharacterized protein n=1 Tax=Nautilia profundicola (strain ATCC BAA-1463 / DSM 18972 / AmH) TaxID=598659 RepID=B9L5T3_NAUPA|nr:hypothetical protein NAMH_1328 [Nautilia profundicola AmH]